MQSYFKNFRNDLPAGLVVFLVALPLCLGIALASGLSDNIFSGIIAGIIGGIVVGSISGSSLGVSGPAAGLTVIIVTALTTLTFREFLVAGIICGVIQLLLGLIKAGVIAYYFPSPVIKGMLAAIGLILIFKQIPHLVGIDKDPEGDLAFHQIDGMNTFKELGYAFKNSKLGAIIIGSISLIILLLWELKYFKKHKILGVIPSALIVVIVGVLINEYFILSFPDLALGVVHELPVYVPETVLAEVTVNSKVMVIKDTLTFVPKIIANDHLVQLPEVTGDKGYLSLLTFPDFKAFSKWDVWVQGFIMAIVASLETLLCVEATDKIDPLKRQTPTNRELYAQGVGNIFSSLIGGLPVTQVIVRSSANVNSGGKTKMAAIYHGVFLLLCVLLIPNILNKIPLSCLAAILIVVGYKLAKARLFINMFKQGWEVFLPFVITITAILWTDLLKGIVIGLAVGIFYVLKANMRVAYIYRKNEEHDDGTKSVEIKLSENVTFLNKANIQNTLASLPENSEIIIDGSDTYNYDKDVLEIMHDFQISAKERNIKVKYINVPNIDTSLVTSH